jgi:energy-coupling factor transport system substrate-specific component
VSATVLAPVPHAARLDRLRPGIVYTLMVLVGVAAFVYPFWLPSEALPRDAHAADAPLWAGVVGALVVAAVGLEVRRHTMTGATVAILGVLSAVAGLLRLVDLPGNNAGIFFVVILAGAAFGPRFGLLLGLCAMAASAVITGGLGPWLPFQMVALGWMGASAGVVGRLTARLASRAEVLVLAAFGWAWGFAFGAVMNLWSWPFLRGSGDLTWETGLGAGETLRRYWSYYVTTSVAWDAAGALCNAVLIVATGVVLLRTFRRFAHRLSPAVELVVEANPTS